MPSRSRSRSSAPTPAPRSPSGRRAAPCSSPRALAGVECAEYAPAHVKQAVCGYGRAEKAQVQRMVQAILGLDSRRRPTTPPTRSRSRSATRWRRRSLQAMAGVIARLRGKPVAARGATGSCSTSTASATSSRRRRACCDGADGADEVTVETYLARARGRAAAVRLRRRGRARAVRAAALRLRRGAEGRARDRLRLDPGRAAARDRARGHGAVRGDPGHRQEDGAARRARAEGEARADAVARRAPPAPRPSSWPRDALVELGYSVVEAERRSPRSIRTCRPRSASGRRCRKAA